MYYSRFHKSHLFWRFCPSSGKMAEISEKDEKTPFWEISSSRMQICTRKFKSQPFWKSQPLGCDSRFGFNKNLKISFTVSSGRSGRCSIVAFLSTNDHSSLDER
jgi:hypothetical protein